jgi:hydroxyquinol 1,2-dioxygenase
LTFVAQQTSPEQITAQVLASFDGAQDPRLQEVLTSLVRHLHGFVMDVGLTEAEWAAAVRELTATGAITDDRRQEFILWSDTLGVSMLVDALAHQVPSGATESTVLGPFYVPGSPVRKLGANIAEQAAGTPALVHGRVSSLDGTPLPGAELDVWQNGENRLYAVQDPDAPDDHLRGKFVTDAGGHFSFGAVRPVPYPIPDDGPVGHMLAAAGRHPWRPAHIHIVVRAPDHKTLTTHIFDAESDSLKRHFQRRDADDPERPTQSAGPWVSLELDLVLAPGVDDEQLVDAGRTH